MNYTSSSETDHNTHLGRQILGSWNPAPKLLVRLILRPSIAPEMFRGGRLNPGQHMHWPPPMITEWPRSLSAVGTRGTRWKCEKWSTTTKHLFNGTIPKGAQCAE